MFWKNAITDTIYIEKIKKETEKQINKFIKVFKIIPNHIDGHNHCNIFNKKIEKIFEEISNKYNIHLRIPYEKIDNYEISLLKNNNYFYDYRKIDNNIDIKTIENDMDYFFKYDMYLNNYMCINNCPKDINFIGTIYGYYRKPDVLKHQLTKFKKDDIIQIMTHPGFYLKILNHKTPFSNKDRIQELKSLKILKNMLDMDDVEYTNYSRI